MSEEDKHWMQKAIGLAKQASSLGEVPVGAVLVKDGTAIGEGFNRPIGLSDPSAHAEMMAIRQAAQNLGNYRLTGTTLYVTLEPCAMCAGLIQHARISRLVFGAYDEKAGACGSLIPVLDHPKRLHHMEIFGGLEAEACRALLQNFFKERRKAKQLEN